MRSMAAESGERLARLGWDALAGADWDTARSCFEQARELDESAEVLDGLGRALHFQGDYPSAIELTEQAFAAYRADGKRVEAADTARWLGFLHGVINCNMAAASGWMARAGELLEGADECAGHGWLVIDRAPFTGDPAEREQLGAAALVIARRFGDTDLEYAAVALLGESQVASGRVAEGMSSIDRAMTAVSSGEVLGIVAVSDICCRLLNACEMALDLRRAEEWMPIAERFAWQEFVPPVCRTHYGGILTAVGRWPEAEEQLLSAIRTLENSYRLMREGPLVRLADLRVRQGRFDEARRLLQGSEAHPIARRALATIALAEGEVSLAEDLVGLCLDRGRADDPSCAPALELLVRIRLARSDQAGALEAIDRLTRLAASSGDESVAAFADLAKGRARAVDADDDAATHLQAALRGFGALDLPLEAARAQFELARSMVRTAPAAAETEAGTALRLFERIGASRDADAAAALLRRLGGGGRAWPKGFGTLTKRETEVLSLLGEGCSNAAIAERLYISRRTAEHHVSNVLSKLDLRSRAEAAAYAVRQEREVP
jgi:DNA-binding CsgD family transcriptional regulator